MNATFEDHPTDPDKVILRKKPRIDQGPDYERGFIDGMQYQTQSSVDKAVNRMAQRTWVGLTDEERVEMWKNYKPLHGMSEFMRQIEAKLKEKNT